MSASVATGLLDRLADTEQAPLWVRVWALAARQADADGVARLDPFEVRWALRIESDRHLQEGAVECAVRKAIELGVLASDSTPEQLRLTAETRAWTGRFEL